MNEFMESVLNFVFDIESDMRNLFDDTTHLQLIVRDNHFSVFNDLSCYLRLTCCNDHENITFHDDLSIWNDFNYENWNLMNVISLDFTTWLIMKIVSFHLFLFLFLYLFVKMDRLVMIKRITSNTFCRLKVPVISYRFKKEQLLYQISLRKMQLLRN